MGAISFLILSMAMVATTCFILWESMSIDYRWKISLNVGSLVILIAAVHYLYMREHWVMLHMSPIVYRYIDWSLTVPLQMIEFYLISSAVKPDLSAGMFYCVLFGTVGMAGWAFILYEIFAGEGGKASAEGMSSLDTTRFIVSIGWSIYPLGYFFGCLLGAVDNAPLSAIYNVADFVNKIWFCLAIWHAAKCDCREKAARL